MIQCHTICVLSRTGAPQATGDRPCWGASERDWNVVDLRTGRHGTGSALFSLPAGFLPLRHRRLCQARVERRQYEGRLDSGHPVPCPAAGRNHLLSDSTARADFFIRSVRSNQIAETTQARDVHPRKAHSCEDTRRRCSHYCGISADHDICLRGSHVSGASCDVGHFRERSGDIRSQPTRRIDPVQLLGDRDLDDWLGCPQISRLWERRVDLGKRSASTHHFFESAL